jgi:galacturan 1,4-alpha-galacturonidase
VAQDNYESDNQPRGGGWGNVTNITFSNFDVTGARRPFYLDQNNGNNGSDTKGTSNMLISDVHVEDFYGKVSLSSNMATLSCSARHPCFDIYFDNMTETGSSGAALTGSCSNTVDGGIHGLDGC